MPTPVDGDLDDVAALDARDDGLPTSSSTRPRTSATGATRPTFERVNVQGTRTSLDAARRAEVRRVVHVGTEAALLHGQPLVAADERTPLAFGSPSLYSATKARAEEVSARGRPRRAGDRRRAAAVRLGRRATRRCCRS